MRLLGLDYGRKRVGVALSDSLGMTAQPFGYLPNNKQLIGELGKLVQEKDVSEIVVGYPRSLSGQTGEMAKEVETFAKRLEQKLHRPIHLWDERFTTSEAENLLISSDVRRSKRKEVRDTIAASLILQGFLASRG